VSLRTQNGPDRFNHALTLYLEDTIRIERRHRTTFYGKVVLAAVAALLLMQAPPHNQGFAGDLALHPQACDAVAASQPPQTWARFAFAGPQFR
jgi:hypothetical protein